MTIETGRPVYQRLQRLREIAQQVGVSINDDTSPLSPPRQIPTFRGPDDERIADVVIGQLRIEEIAAQPQTRGLKRAFSAKKSQAAPTYKELYAALTRVIDENGLAGVVEVLLSRFKAVGGDVNLSRRGSTNVFKKIATNGDNQEQRGRLLQAATEKCRPDFVLLLSPSADQTSLDESLGVALAKRELGIIETLLSYGANATMFNALFQSTARHGDHEVLNLLLRAPKRPPLRCITESLLPATTVGSLRSVSLLVQAGADGEHDNASALMYAIEVYRVDLAVTIIMGSSPPSAASLDRAIGFLFSAATANLNHCLLMVEALLCGGPQGHAANEGLFKATTLANIEMMRLLVENNVDINYNNAYAVGHAIQRNRVDLLGLLLQNQKLRPEFASESVGCIPPASPPRVKVAVLSMLLLHGASGIRCNELLIIAVECDDVETVQLLVAYGRDNNSGPVVSVDYKAAQGLQVAVSRGNLTIVKLLVTEGRPSKFSLSKAFPLISNVNEECHYLMTQILLDAGAEGPEVDAALRTAVTGKQRSKKLIELLVRNGANVNGQTLLMAVSQGNADILQILLTGSPSVATSSAAIPLGMRLQDDANRFHITKLLLPYATTSEAEGNEIAQALIDLLQNSPEDVKLVRLLCQEGKANINFHYGQAVTMAVGCANPIVLDIVLQSSGDSPTPQTIAKALAHAMELPLTDLHRHHKVDALLRRAKPQEALNHALIQEVRSALSVKRDLSIVQTLLAAGADVNCLDGAPVCFAVRDPAIMDLLLVRRPTHNSLSMAFPLAVTLQDPARYTLCEKLLKAGAHGDEVSKALFAAAKEGVSAIPFMKLLLPQADVNYKEGRVLRLVVRRVFREGLDLLLTQRSHMPTMASKWRAFEDAMDVRNKQDRFDMVKKLLEAGTKGEIVSGALLTAVNSSDLPLTELLLQSGASVEYKAGKAVHSAASSGDREILKRLVGGILSPKPTLSTLTTGFGGAMSLKEKDRESHYLTLQILLSVGMRGEAVDAALVDAVKEGESSITLTELLYSNGASVEWQEGEALDMAARSGFVKTLTVLLGSHVSQNVLKRIYRSSLSLPKDQRTGIIELILRAGKTIDKHVTNTLLQATQESPVDRQLVQLLLGYQVFDEGQSMTQAGQALDLETLAILVASPKAPMFISSAFEKVVSAEIPWQSNRGLAVMEAMLVGGAVGEPVAEALLKAVHKRDVSGDALAREFVDLFLRFHADVNYQRGLVLQRACQQGDADLIRKLLPNATSDSRSMAFPYLFVSSSDEPWTLRMIELFTDESGENERIDVDFKHPDPGIDPILFMALRKFPRKTQVLRTLLEVGFSPNQWQFLEYDSNVGIEPVTILCWALSQPEKKISIANIDLLIESGANVNFVLKSHITPVMLSIENQRPEILKKLISKGANVTTPDSNGVTPLALASRMGNSVVMEHLLKADAETDDGSLHDAARELRCDAMRVLIKYHHDVDFPSERHDGRSALAELCLKAIDNGPRSELEEAIECLIANRADIRLRCMGKTIFHYALDSSDPLSILPVLLKILWKVINEDCYLYTDGKCTYSLTKYVEKGISLGPGVQREEIIKLLKKKRAADRLWANSIDEPQPIDLCGAPQYIMDEVDRQRVREKRMSEQRIDALAQVELKRMLVIEESKILQIQTDEEIRRDKEKAQATGRILEDQAGLQLQIESRAEIERQRLLQARQKYELNHVEAIGAAQVATQREIGQAKIENGRAEHIFQLEYMEQRAGKENEGVLARLAIEESVWEEREAHQLRAHEREMTRMMTQKAVLDSNAALANNLRAGGANQRQIGYVMGEV